jgi:hypothetical protein
MIHALKLKDLHVTANKQRINKMDSECNKCPHINLEALEKASGFGRDVYVDGGEFKVDMDGGSYKFPYAIGLVNWHGEFEEFIIAIDEEERVRTEEKRIEGIKKAALGKLSEEEREVLGLI